MRKTSKAVGYCALIGFVLLIYSALWYISEKVEYKYLGNNFNMVSYVAMLFLIAAFVCVLLFLSFRRERNKLLSSGNPGNDHRLDRILAIAMFVCGIAFLYLVYLNENSIYPANSGAGHLRSMVSRPVYSVLMGCLFVLFVLFFRNGAESLPSVRLLFILICAFLCAAKTFAPNPFLGSEHETNHMHAYVNSIINIANLHPFDWHTASVYGHYGLLCLPLVKLLGNSYTAVALSVSVFAFISFYCVFSVCNQWIRKNAAFFLTVLAICGIPFMIYGGEYFQVNPQRLLFPAVTLYAISKIIKKDIRGFWMWFLEAAVGILAVIWNLETGLFSIAVLCAFNLVMSLRENAKCKTILLILGKDIAFALLCFCGAYLIINLYSLLTGATQWMSLQRFIYPINSLVPVPGEQSIYKITDLRTGFVTPFSVYVVQLIIFSVTILNALRSLLSKEMPQEHKKSRILLLSVALSGLSSVIYFVNRAAYANISISWMQMMMVLGVYGGEGLSELQRTQERKDVAPFLSRLSGKMLMLLYVFVFAVEGIMGFEPYMKSQIRAYWNTETLDTVVEQGKQHIPEDVLAIGHGVPELFFQMHRNDYPALMDWSDMNSINFQKAQDLVDEAVGQQKPILIGRVSWGLDDYIMSKGYNSVWEMTAGCITFRLMEPQKAEN